MKRIDCCRVCGSKNIAEFLDLGEQPLANSLLKSPDEKENLYPLSLSQCDNCSLVQLNHTASPEELFSNYVWVTATSSTAKKHSIYFYDQIVSKVNDLKEGYILETASNDGTFLLPFIKNGYKVLGVDPAQNIADVANKNNIPTVCNFFGVKAAEEIIAKHGHAKVVFARNVLPHVANLHDFVKGLSICMEDDGLLVIEAHYARIIYEELHYDSIYHEHLCYFTLKSLENLLNRHSLFVTDIKESPISGGSLILYIKKKKKEEPIVQSYRNSEKNIKINELNSWKQFAEHVKSHREKLLGILEDIVQKNGSVVGYGASARSSTLLNFCKIGEKFVSIIADQNPLKHGLYTAGTHIPISSPENVMKKNPRHIFILAWNFTDEIVKILKTQFGFNGKCILPLPNNPRIIDVRGN